MLWCSMPSLICSHLYPIETKQSEMFPLEIAFSSIQWHCMNVNTIENRLTMNWHRPSISFCLMISSAMARCLVSHSLEKWAMMVFDIYLLRIFCVSMRSRSIQFKCVVLFSSVCLSVDSSEMNLLLKCHWFFPVTQSRTTSTFEYQILFAAHKINFKARKAFRRS